VKVLEQVVGLFFAAIILGVVLYYYFGGVQYITAISQAAVNLRNSFVPSGGYASAGPNALQPGTTSAGSGPTTMQLASRVAGA
jgi:hypothetical protein